MYHLSSEKSSKPQSPQKARLLGELEDARRSLSHKADKMRQLVEIMQRLEEAQERQSQERRWELPRTTRHSMHYRSQEHDWRVHNFDKWHHQHCTALVVGSNDVASSYCIGVLRGRQAGRREGGRGVRIVASY